MECTFLNAAGVTLFVRDDMLSGHWVQQEMNVSAEFPYKADKVIQIGMRMAFRDPATDTIEVFEVVNAQNREPGHRQSVTADHICIAELSDEHINTTEITNKTASEALSTALTGTLWSVGTNTASGAQNGDFSRGSVWDAVNTIKENWNVYITPRVVISSGVITGRYLDITPAEGVWHGLRLSIRKNMLDPVVTYDDTEVYTALYGYGGNVDKPQTGGDDRTEELTFADQVWTATSEHPAKPLNQTYLEWPEKTAIYGRNGRARYGYYQNGNIKDSAILLQKTWESLKQASEPRITVSGTCVDLYRLGYAGQPIRLHDIALVEIEETGELLHKQIVCNDVDLINPDNTRPEIGDYIPNIIYINREANRRGGGGGGGHGQTNEEDDDVKTWTDFVKTNNLIGMVAGYKDGNQYIKAGQIVLAINESGESGGYESAAYVNADHVNISATNTAHLLAGSIVYDENGRLVLKESSGGGIYVERTEQGTTSSFGIWDKGNLTGGIMVQQINGQTGTKLTLGADVIDINGLVTALLAYDVTVKTLSTVGTATFEGDVYAPGLTITDGGDINGFTNITGTNASFDTLTVDENNTVDCGNIDCNDIDCGGINADGIVCLALNVGGSDAAYAATWQTETIPTLTFSNRYNFVYKSNGVEYTSLGYIVGSHGSKTIHYLGSATT